VSYGARVDALLDRLGGDLTEADFRSLALACIDQAGVGTRDQDAIRGILQADAVARDRIAARIADLETIEPTPGLEDRAVARAVREGVLRPVASECQLCGRDDCRHEPGCEAQLL